MERFGDPVELGHVVILPDARGVRENGDDGEVDEE